jgi:hypothetical protein
MSLYARALSTYELSRATKLPMNRINFLIARYELESSGKDDRGERLYWLADVKTAAKDHERGVELERADWA